MKLLKTFKCKLVGHQWDSTHGLYEYPNEGAICERCGTVFIINRKVTHG